jgi:hypothetical protein
LFKTTFVFEKSLLFFEKIATQKFSCFLFLRIKENRIVFHIPGEGKNNHNRYHNKKSEKDIFFTLKNKNHC